MQTCLHPWLIVLENRLYNLFFSFAYHPPLCLFIFLLHSQLWSFFKTRAISSLTSHSLSSTQSFMTNCKGPLSNVWPWNSSRLESESGMLYCKTLSLQGRRLNPVGCKPGLPWIRPDSGRAVWDQVREMERLLDMWQGTWVRLGGQ